MVNQSIWSLEIPRVVANEVFSKGLVFKGSIPRLYTAIGRRYMCWFVFGEPW